MACCCALLMQPQSQLHMYLRCCIPLLNARYALRHLNHNTRNTALQDMAQRDVELGSMDDNGTRSPRSPVISGEAPYGRSNCSNEESDIIFDFDKSKLSPAQQHRLETWGDAIQPHTDEGGDAYYIGDAYEGIDSTCLREWRTQRRVVAGIDLYAH